MRLTRLLAAVAAGATTRAFRRPGRGGWPGHKATPVRMKIYYLH
jgi:hypothetical protein